MSEGMGGQFHGETSAAAGGTVHSAGMTPRNGSHIAGQRINKAEGTDAENGGYAPTDVASIVVLYLLLSIKKIFPHRNTR